MSDSVASLAVVDPLRRDEYQRDDKLWFANGEIVLVANRKIAFKVFTELLCRESAVFRDLINRDVPQPDQQEMMENCPVVHITDEPEDFKTFLTLIYDGWRFRKNNSHRKWAVVRVMISLGDKYQATDFYDEGIELLRLTFPRRVESWGANQGIEDALENVISLAKITRDLDPDLYACVLFLCCRLPIAELTAGLLHEGKGLPLDILHRCLQGREELPMFWHDAMADFYDGSPPTLCVGENCKQLSHAYQCTSATAARLMMESGECTYDPLSKSAWQHLVYIPGICQFCQQRYTQKSIKLSQEFRDRLQKRFGCIL